MPLDPQAQAVLDFLIASGRPPLNTLSPAEARAVARLSAPVFALPAEPVAAAEDRTIPGPGGAIPVRLYRPRGSAAAERLPVLVFCHGGGFVIGDLETHDRTCRALANRAGAAVLAVDYRLGPEHRFPAAVEDAWAATRFVAEHGAALGLDPARLAVGGDSAGANLAAVSALLARDSGLTLAGQILFYPVTDFAGGTQSYRDFADGYMLTREAMDWFSSHYLRGPDDIADWRASPLRARDLAGAAPALVVTAGFDPLCDEGKAYADRLAAAGVPTRYRCFAGMIHGFLGMTKALAAAGQALDEAAAALREAFAPAGAG